MVDNEGAMTIIFHPFCTRDRSGYNDYTLIILIVYILQYIPEGNLSQKWSMNQTMNPISICRQPCGSLHCGTRLVHS